MLFFRYPVYNGHVRLMAELMGVTFGPYIRYPAGECAVIYDVLTDTWPGIDEVLGASPEFLLTRRGRNPLILKRRRARHAYAP